MVIGVPIIEVKTHTSETVSKAHIEPEAPKKLGRNKPKTLQSPALVAKARKVAAKRPLLCPENVQEQRLGKLI